MSIVFVDPPSPPGFVSFRHSHGGYGENCRTSRLKLPTLDVFHAASLLLERGVEAALVDSVLLDHDPAECVAAVLEKDPSMVFFRTSSGSCAHDLRVAERLKRDFAGPVAFCGPHAAVEAETILQSPGVDAVVTGESPFSYLEIAKSGFDRVPGVRRKRSGRVVKNPTAAFMSQDELDALPVPRWDLVDYRRYSYVTSQTSWGCPFGCGYCPYPVTQGTQWRARAVGAVVDEFLRLRARYGLRFVMLRDPEFSLERKRTAELCSSLIAAGTPLMWGCETRLDTLDAGLIELMARAGCVRVAFGVDSVETATLAAMGRRSRGLDDIKEKVRLLKSGGMLTYGMYIVGLPRETRDSTNELIDFALELGTEAASFSMATPFPGTRLERWGRGRGFIEAKDPAHLTGCVPSMRNEAMGLAEIEELYLSAKESWKKQKEPERPRRLSSALSSLP
ncbi:MAG: radical SAM protein [Elusimicrobia bacterium]|nr:radical SAM protein [Elusimicrobiota bacterium]